MRNKITLLAICFTLVIGTVFGNQSSHSGNAVAGVSTSSLSSLRGPLLPQISPKTVRVRLKHVETNADIVDWPYPGSEIIIKAGEAILNKKTDEDGVVVFDAVPCGRQIVVTVKNGDGDEDGVFYRKLACSTRQVDLGIIERMFGGKYTLRQRKLQPMGYDATRNVWLTADGKVVPMRTFRRIMSRRR